MRDGVVVFGHYGQLNLGDEAVAAACFSGALHALPSARMLGFSLDPIDTHLKHDVASVGIRVGDWRNDDQRPIDLEETQRIEASPGLRSAVRRIRVLRKSVLLARKCRGALVRVAREIGSLPRTWRALSGVRTVIIAGSNQMMDHFGGPWGFPYTLIKWAVMARLRGASVVMLSVGAGPLDGWLGRRMILWTLSLTSYVSVRDPGSARLLKSIGWQKPVPVMPDLAFGLEVEALARKSRFAQGVQPNPRPTVAVNLMPVHDPRYWPQSDPRIHREYLQAMADLVTNLLDKDYDVVMFGTQPADEWIAEDTLARLALRGERRERARLERISTLEELCGLYAKCDAVVATRFHGILIALRAGKPVLGICYYRKSRELLESFGLGAYAVDIDKLGSARLIDHIAALAASEDSVVKQMREGVETRRQQLREQYSTALATSAPPDRRTVVAQCE